MMIVILVDILIVAALLVADLVSKAYAANILSDGRTRIAIKNVLSFRYQENSGAAFGMFHDARVFLCVFVSVVLSALIAFMAYHIAKKKYKEKGSMFLHVCLSMIVAGGLGNLIDRIAFGYVRDFIDYTIVYTVFKKHFAICNLADVYLTLGVIMVACYLIWLIVQESKKGVKKSFVAADQSDASSSEDPSSEPKEAGKDG